MTQVTIVGGGPVGMGLAVELGQRDIDVLVLEKDPVLHSIPKGQNLTQRTMEHFRRWAVEQGIRSARLMPAEYPAAGVNAWRSLSSGHAHSWFRRSEVGKYYFAANERLPQYLTEEVLRRRVEDLPTVSVSYGERVTGVAMTEERDDAGVEVTTDRGSHRSRFVVGCDGSRSVVRRSVGIDEEVRDHDRRMVLVVFRSTELARYLETEFGPVAFYSVLHPDLDGYWRFLGSVDVVEQFFFHAPVPAGTELETFDHQALIDETIGRHFAVELDHIGFWDLRVAIARHYRRGPCLLAGDAAHSHPPYGGYGINTGLEDARNLGWKLAAHLQGWGTERLLDSYEAERRPVFVSTAEDFIEAFIERDRRFLAENETTMHDADRFAAAWARRRAEAGGFGISDFAPHYSGSPIVADGGVPTVGGGERRTPSAVGEHGPQARPGHHLPPNEAHPDLFDQLGPWFTLLVSPERAELVADLDRAAESLRMPVRSLVVHDMTSWGTSAILVRPDDYIGWVDGQGRSSMEDALSIVSGR